MSSLSDGSSTILDEHRTSGCLPVMDAARSIFMNLFPGGRRTYCSLVSKSVFMSIESSGFSLSAELKKEMCRETEEI